MKRILMIAASAALALGGLALGSPTASADDRLCRGTISGEYIDGNIIVPAGATCTISDVRLDGNIQSQGHASVTVSNSRVGGSIQLEQGGAVHLSGNTVGGDIQLFSNTYGSKVLNNNYADGNIQCKSNTPAPTGTGNSAGGNLEDQCANLRPATGGTTGPGSGSDGSSVDIYVTEGRWSKGGREWSTYCGSYSSTVERCTTRIWATQVVHSGGRYVNQTGWHFNNLTYKAAPRSTWTTNPLGGYGQYAARVTWTSDGRAWRTECDSDVTGRNGCRSYVTASVVERSGSGYRTVTKQIFNNMVRFS